MKFEKSFGLGALSLFPFSYRSDPAYTTVCSKLLSIIFALTFLVYFIYEVSEWNNQKNFSIREVKHRIENPTDISGWHEDIFLSLNVSVEGSSEYFLGNVRPFLWFSNGITANMTGKNQWHSWKSSCSTLGYESYSYPKNNSRWGLYGKDMVDFLSVNNIGIDYCALETKSGLEGRISQFGTYAHYWHRWNLYQNIAIFTDTLRGYDMSRIQDTVGCLTAGLCVYEYWLKKVRVIRYSRWWRNVIDSEEIVYAYFSQRSSTSSYTNYNDAWWLNGQVFGMDIIHYLDINEVKREIRPETLLDLVLRLGGLAGILLGAAIFIRIFNMHQFIREQNLINLEVLREVLTDYESQKKKKSSAVAIDFIPGFFHDHPD